VRLSGASNQRTPYAVHSHVIDAALSRDILLRPPPERARDTSRPRRDMSPLRRGIFSSNRYSPAGLRLSDDTLGSSLVEVDSQIPRRRGDRGAGCALLWPHPATLKLR
jgi:hypothetical protein